MSPLVVLPDNSSAFGSSVCGACKQFYGSTCCEQRNDVGPQFPMTYAEAQRIAKATGQKVTDAVEYRNVSVGDEARLADWVSGLVADGKGLFLPIENGACRYLVGKQCSIPSAKPHICAMFPFSPDANGDWTVEEFVSDKGFCFAVDSSDGDPQAAMTMFGYSEADLNKLRNRWRLDYRTHQLHMKGLQDGKIGK